MKREMWGKHGTNGVAPAIVLTNPKYPNNVGMVLRLASSYGIKQVWFTGDRVRLDVEGGKRLPREERMKGYGEVDLINYDYPFDRFPQGVTPVGVEVMEGAEPLFSFEHPENAVYVFGPEDGGLDHTARRHCHRFVVIPTRHCLNLATAVATVLYDRASKRSQKGLEAPITPGEWEGRGGLRVDPDDGLGWQDAHDDVTHNPTGTMKRT